MSKRTTTGSATSQPRFWRADRDQYLVDPAHRDDKSGRLSHPVPEAGANRWVVIREMYDDEDPHELPTPLLIGEFGYREIAERICQLIIATAGRSPS